MKEEKVKNVLEGLFIEKNQDEQNEDYKEIEVQKKKKQSPFDYHYKFFRGNLAKDEYNNIQEYLFFMHLSNSKKIIDELSNIIMYDIPLDKLIPMLSLILKYKKINNIYYPKKPKIKNEKYLNSVKWYFKINDNTARRYIKKLNESELKIIEDSYKVSL